MHLSNRTNWHLTKGLFVISLVFSLACVSVSAKNTPLSPIVEVSAGVLKGEALPGTNVVAFKGIPFAMPPVKELRWRAPRQVRSWQGTRDASKFEKQCMQLPLFADMQFRSAGVSEDCLYLNVWAPQYAIGTDNNKTLPILLYFYGGGFAAGDTSEPRYDGASMASKDIIVITANYRLGIFGLLAHPKLSAENGYKGSGNYTFMDQIAALNWVVENAHYFGGDKKRITIGGESAGSLSVSALMASPLSKHLIAGAIGQSGSLLGPTLGAISLHEAEKTGKAMSDALQAQLTKTNTNAIFDLKALRAMDAKDLLEKAAAAGFQWFLPTVDGYVFKQSPITSYQQNEHANVPMLAGNNSQEGSYTEVIGKGDTKGNINYQHYATSIQKLYPKHFAEVLGYYRIEGRIEGQIEGRIEGQIEPSTQTTEKIKDAAQALASDRFISFSTWNWIDLVSQKGNTPAYYYEYSHVRPAPLLLNGAANSNQVSGARGAVHSAEIEYALGNLRIQPAYHWQADDHKVSALMQEYFANFIKTGNPNGDGLPTWPLFTDNQRLNINLDPYVEDIQHLRKRYEFHRQYYFNER